MLALAIDDGMNELSYSENFSSGKATPIFRERKEILYRRLYSTINMAFINT